MFHIQAICVDKLTVNLLFGYVVIHPVNCRGGWAIVSA